MVSTRHHPGEFPPPSTPSPSTSKRASNGWFHTPSTIVTLWLLISSLVVLWDAGFIFCRPHSLPGGSIHFIWAPYAMYSTVDYLYGWPGYNSKNGFVTAQSAVNILESVMYLFYLTVVFRNGTSIGPRGGSKKTKKSVPWFLFAEKSVDGRSGMIALLLVFTTCVMTLSKTTLYLLNEVFSGFDNISHNDAFSLVFLYAIPNGLWIVFPTYAVYFFGSEILDALENASRVSGLKES